MDRFQANEVVREMLEGLGPVLRTLPADLKEQLRRAAVSVSLNLQEGRGRSGKDRAHCFRIAYGSAREATAALEAAVALGEIDARGVAVVLARLDSLRAILWRMIHGRRN